ncbi:MAG: hypothetical protein AAF456_21095 [Planctomycetota bacterium]
MLVVHGVGDPDPGHTLTTFARSLAGEDSPLEDHGEVIWLNEKPVDPDHVQTFESHVRRLDYEGQKLEIAEVFWGDQSRVSHGIFGVFYGLFQILFGLRFVAYVAADQNSSASEWLQRLGLISSRILHGPVLAVTYFLVLLSGAVFATQLSWAESYRGLLWTTIVLSVICAFGLLSSNIGTRITKSRVIHRFWYWVNVTVAFVAGLLVIKIIFLNALFPQLHFEAQERLGLIWYCRMLVILLGLLWMVEVIVVIAMGACWLASYCSRGAYRPAINVAFLLPALAVGAWGFGLPLTWAAAREGISSIGHLPEYRAVFDETIPLLGVQFIMLLVISTTALITVFRYFRWKATLKAGERPASRGPRLIVHPSLQIVLAISTLIGVSLVMLLGYQQFNGFCYYNDNFILGQLMADANKIVFLLIPLGGIAFLLIPRLRPVLDILLDVVNHFYFRATSIQDALDDDDEFDIKETTFESGSLFFSRRDAIISRLKRILIHYRDEVGNSRPELVIIAHSQGTMFAIEALNDPELGWLKNCFRSTTLVTMGSPFKHLYQHYFGHIFPSLDKPFWSDIRKQADRWINLYRIDDYVGREIDFPRNDGWCETEMLGNGLDSVTVNPKCEYRNYRLGPRGHMSYWTDRAAIEILRQELLSNARLERRAA